MSNKEIGTVRTEQPAYTPAGTDFILLESGGNSRVATIDELSVLLSGSTTTQGLTDSKQGARVHKNNSGAAQVAGPIQFVAADFDTNNFFAGGSPSRLTVPAGVTKVKLTGLVTHTGTGSTNSKFVHFNSVGTELDTSGLPRGVTGTSNLVSGVISVTPGDYFEFESDTTSVATSPEFTWFEIEVVEQLP